MSFAFTNPRVVATGILLIGLTLVAFAVFFVVEAALLTIDAGHATGTVVAKRIDPTYFASGSSSGSQDPNAYFIAFEFSPEGGGSIRSEQFVSRESYDAVEVGATVGVDYVRLVPGTMNALSGYQTPLADLVLPAIAAGATGSLFAFLGGRVVVGAIRMRRLLAHLAQVGLETTGRVTDNDAAQLLISGNLQRKVAFRYAVAGRDFDGRSDWMPRADAAALKKGDRGVVRYDPADPARSAWYGPAATGEASATAAGANGPATD